MKRKLTIKKNVQYCSFVVFFSGFTLIRRNKCDYSLAKAPVLTE